MALVISDTGPLWSFSAVGRLELLGQRLIDRVSWTTAVAEEIRRNAEKWSFLAEVLKQDWLPDPVDLGIVSGEVLREALRIRSVLASPRDHPLQHLGEAETIAYAKYLGAGVITEDSDACKRARFMDLQVLRTTDLLAEMVAMGDCTEQMAWGIYKELVELGRLPPNLTKRELFG